MIGHIILVFGRDKSTKIYWLLNKKKYIVFFHLGFSESNG